MLVKPIVFFDQPMNLACDGRCDKAFGINGRPRRQLGSDVDDHVFKPDSELGAAPKPGATQTIAEGGHMKPSATPLTDATKMNKWCARECERSTMAEVGKPIVLPDMEYPRPNCPYLHPGRVTYFMRVQSVWKVPGRTGTVGCVMLDHVPRCKDLRETAVGLTLHRNDGVEWTIRGIEAFAKLAGPTMGEPIGILVDDEPVAIAVEDLVMIVYADIPRPADVP